MVNEHLIPMNVRSAEQDSKNINQQEIVQQKLYDNQMVNGFFSEFIKKSFRVFVIISLCPTALPFYLLFSSIARAIQQTSSATLFLGLARGGGGDYLWHI
jgi:hypothetical protein